MRKLIVTCQCGQRMQVPRSAVGKTGLCPTCGQIVTIGNENASATPPPKAGGRPLHARQVWWEGRNNPPEDAKRKFGEAVDLYYAGRYGEALAIFDGLAKQFPGNPDIENGRQQCLSALRRPPAALEDNTHGAPPQAPPSSREPLQGSFDEDTVRRVIVEKMLYGGTEAVQLQAAELAARLLGMFPEQGRKSNSEASAQGPAPQSGTDEPAEASAPISEAEGVEPSSYVDVFDQPAPQDEPAPDAHAREETFARPTRIPMPSESDLERDRKQAIGL
ncbi:MAG: hypothetical protein RBU21_02750 [FCB group bacterium]|jgi:hypothetical protein|nr:hypothetical protein [FCB group bacterium]